MLKDNLKNVEERVQAACDRAGRKREEVTLIAVSKTKPVEMLQEFTMKISGISAKIKCRSSVIKLRKCQRTSNGI